MSTRIGGIVESPFYSLCVSRPSGLLLPLRIALSMPMLLCRLPLFPVAFLYADLLSRKSASFVVYQENVGEFVDTALEASLYALTPE